MVAFWLKKIVSYWLMPLPLVLLLLALGVWLTARDRTRRLGRRFSLVALGLLLLLSNRTFSGWLLYPCEITYPAIPEITPTQPVPATLATCRYIVVLGGGHAYTPDLPASGQLSPAALARITEGIRLARALPDATLIVSGPRNHDDEPSHAEVQARTATTLGGLAPARIRLIEEVRDTHDEAPTVRTLVGDAPVALVTSAAHLRRATALFRHAGVTVVPCPTDFQRKPGAAWAWSDLGCDVESLGQSTSALHEYLGLIWMKLRGQG